MLFSHIIYPIVNIYFFILRQSAEMIWLIDAKLNNKKLWPLREHMGSP